MSDLKDRLLEEKLIVILRGLAEEKLIATVDILKNMGTSGTIPRLPEMLMSFLFP